jgi:hypothetical protein
MKSFVSSLSFAAAAVFGLGVPATASTLSVIDAPGLRVYDENSSACNGAIPGKVIYRNCTGGPELLYASEPYGALAFFSADISSLYGTSFDNVYLSLTEARTFPNAAGSVKLYAANADVLTPYADGLGYAQYIPAIDDALAAGTTYLGTLQGKGEGGNHLLFNLTGAISTAISQNITRFGLLLGPDGMSSDLLTLLGRNYNSGFDDCKVSATNCQYYASSLYEYPSLIVTLGNEITPLANLPSRPIVNDPTEPPPPAEVPEPATAWLLFIGFAFCASQAIIRRGK